ncbi:hypothetical protein GCM10009630_69520 [Kribbella jejuensis]|uniref:Uncharacterized protein n=1 Tax=Kribbella jejuensis TaxID=236068 RepID=A0A542EQM0_9ACTN|nr:hypothetical protein [Kribbella jejuensis]TQJ17619.1 hypothetical protein FB475_1743 [Kribbella jejuensis]
MSASPYSDLPSVADVAGDIAGVVERFGRGETHSFAFGDGGVPEAVIASYDQYEDLGGEESLGRYQTVLSPEMLARQLPEMVEAIRRGSFGPPVVVGGTAEPLLVVMSTQQYRTMRGDDEPPPGVIDDPTVRTYDSSPTPGSTPFSVDEWAKDDPFTQQMLDEIRHDG